MTILKLAILASTMWQTAGWQATVSTMEGRSFQGEVATVTAKAVMMELGTESATIPVDSVLNINFQNPEAPGNNAAVQQQTAVQLRDGSILSAESLAATADEISLTNDALKELKFARSIVRAIRLKPMQQEFELQWDGFMSRSEDKDLLVIQKRNSDGLDFLAGNIAAINETEILFLLDGDEIPVPRTRVFGIVFAELSESNLKGSIMLRTTDGQVIMANSVEFAANEFRIETSWRQSLKLPQGTVTEIDFSSGRLHYLSDLKPITEEYFGLDPVGQEWGTLFDADRKTRTGLSSQWKMSTDRFMNNGRPSLTLRSKTYSKGLCLFPSAKVEYALDRQYSQFTAIVGVDDDVAFQQPRKGQQTMVELRVEADGEILFQQLISAIADPIKLNLPVTNRNTLSIFVDFGDNSSVCDYLDLANAVLVVQAQDN